MNYASYYRPNTRPRSKPSRPTYQNPTDNPLYPKLNYGGPNQMWGGAGGQATSYQGYQPPSRHNPPGFRPSPGVGIDPGFGRPTGQPGLTWSPEAGQYVQSDPSGNPIRRYGGAGRKREQPRGPYQPGYLGGGGYGQQRPGYSIYQPPVSSGGGYGIPGYGGAYQGSRPGRPQSYVGNSFPNDPIHQQSYGQPYTNPLQVPGYTQFDPQPQQLYSNR